MIIFTSNRPLENGNSLFSTCNARFRSVKNGNHKKINVSMTVRPIRVNFENLSKKF